MAECLETLNRTGAVRRSHANTKPNEGPGSVFNRAHGNVSRCEVVQGEVLIVVYPPRGSGTN
jgi:hypothetical protein